MAYKICQNIDECREQLIVLVDAFDKGYADYRKGAYSEAQVRIDFLNPLLKCFGWDVDKVFPHKHWTGKDCPVLLLDDWEELLSDISEHLDALRSGDRVSGRLSGREDEFEFSDGESEISVEDFDIDHDELGKIIGES